MRPWQNRFDGLILANLCLFRLSDVFQKMGTSLQRVKKKKSKKTGKIYCWLTVLSEESFRKTRIPGSYNVPASIRIGVGAVAAGWGKYALLLLASKKR